MIRYGSPKSAEACALANALGSVHVRRKLNTYRICRDHARNCRVMLLCMNIHIYTRGTTDKNPSVVDVQISSNF